jgi:hypothetical protein
MSLNLIQWSGFENVNAGKQSECVGTQNDDGAVGNNGVVTPNDYGHDERLRGACWAT